MLAICNYIQNGSTFYLGVMWLCVCSVRSCCMYCIMYVCIYVCWMDVWLDVRLYIYDFVIIMCTSVDLLYVFIHVCI